jgi:hypothetical protein
MDLMVLEGKWKMDSVLSPRYNFEHTLVTALRNGEIEVSENGATFLQKCIWSHMKYKTICLSKDKLNNLKQIDLPLLKLSLD